MAPTPTISEPHARKRKSRFDSEYGEIKMQSLAKPKIISIPPLTDIEKPARSTTDNLEHPVSSPDGSNDMKSTIFLEKSVTTDDEKKDTSSPSNILSKPSALDLLEQLKKRNMLPMNPPVQNTARNPMDLLEKLKSKNLLSPNENDQKMDVKNHQNPLRLVEQLKAKKLIPTPKVEKEKENLQPKNWTEWKNSKATEGPPTYDEIEKQVRKGANFRNGQRNYIYRHQTCHRKIGFLVRVRKIGTWLADGERLRESDKAPHFTGPLSFNGAKARMQVRNDFMNWERIGFTMKTRQYETMIMIRRRELCPHCSFKLDDPHRLKQETKDHFDDHMIRDLQEAQIKVKKGTKPTTPWYPNPEEWLVKKEKKEEPMPVLMDAKSTGLKKVKCPVCLEFHTDYFDDKEESWKYREAVERDHKIVHIACLNGFKIQNEETMDKEDDDVIEC